MKIKLKCSVCGFVLETNNDYATEMCDKCTHRFSSIDIVEFYQEEKEENSEEIANYDIK